MTYEHPVDLVPVVRTKLSYDMLPCEHNYWDALKIIPGSDEGQDMMHAESHQRMKAIAPFRSMLDTYSVLCADIITEVMYKNLQKQMDPDEYDDGHAAQWHDVTLAQNREIVRGAIYPILAHLLESGMVVPA
jgi:hypothetical protein